VPELPDVEHVRRRLQRGAAGRRIRRVRVLSPSTVRSPAPGRFARLLRSRRIAGVRRRGKYLLLHLTGGWTLVAHLRMTGDFVLAPASRPLAPHTRVVFSLDGREVRFVDQRRFGHMDLVPTAALGAHPALRRVGVEPLSRAFTAPRLRRLLQRRRGGLKAALLRQDLVAGIGNLYADEILFQARLSPARQAGDLSRAELDRLHGALRAVLRRAVRAGAGGEWPARSLLAVREPGGACPRCRRPLAVRRVAGRTTYCCPACQR
jgi:formamidopyrimidine-DNA glycosylase